MSKSPKDEIKEKETYEKMLRMVNDRI